jgi:hypothetical protein
VIAPTRRLSCSCVLVCLCAESICA